jgi:hypothetical protein
VIPGAFGATERQLRQFAWTAPVGLALVGYFVRRLGGPSIAPWIGLGAGLAILAAGLVRPTSLRLVFGLAMLVALPIGWLVSNVFLLVFWLVLIVPLALLFRLAGRDALAIRARGESSAWTPRQPPGDVGSYYRQG